MRLFVLRFVSYASSALIAICCSANVSDRGAAGWEGRRRPGRFWRNRRGTRTSSINCCHATDPPFFAAVVRKSQPISAKFLALTKQQTELQSCEWHTTVSSRAACFHLWKTRNTILQKVALRQLTIDFFSEQFQHYFLLILWLWCRRAVYVR